MMRDILIGAVVIAVIIILLRLIFGSPLVKRISESFANPTSLINKTTECPKGAEIYIYDGISYCCSGTVNGSADSVKKTCRPLSGRDATTVFCSLGPSTKEVKNCLELRSGLMQAEGMTFCPSATPTFVKPDGSTGTTGRCCGPPGGNSGLTDCAPGVTASCEVAADPDPFKNPASCQFKKAQEEDGACPATYGPFTAARGPITIYGCTNTATNCYKQATIDRLRSFGHDVTGLVVCA
jgi:hypothetical protein